MEILIAIICVIIGYLCGSFPTAVVIGKVFFGVDVREKGSHNAGGTNAGRVLGKKVGLIVIIIDVLKCIIPMWIAYLVFTYTELKEITYLPLSYYLVGVGSVIGHCFPVFAGFRGGKAVSSFGGFILGTNWLLAIIGISFFMLILKIKKYVSLASILASLFIGAIVFIPFFAYTMNIGMQYDLSYAIIMAVIAIYVLIRHHSNIGRLIRHEESKITWMGGSKKKDDHKTKIAENTAKTID